MKRETAQKLLNIVYIIRDILTFNYFMKKTLSEMLHWTKGRPERLWAFWHLGMRYIFDDLGSDFPQSAEQTWFHKGGDCEDAAIFFQDVLLVNFNKPSARLFRIVFEEPNSFGQTGHIICLYKNSSVCTGWHQIGSDLYDYPRLVSHLPEEIAFSYEDRSKRRIKRAGFGRFQYITYPDKPEWIWEEVVIDREEKNH